MTATPDAAATAEAVAAATREANETVVAEARAATATTRAATTATARWMDDHSAVPGTYEFNSEWRMEEEVVEDVTVEEILTIQKIEYDGSLVTAHVSEVVQYSDEGTGGATLIKRSDLNCEKYASSGCRNPTIYLEDNFSRRYPLLGVGGEFAEDVVMTHGYVASGRYSFPAPEPGSYVFSFRMDDQGVVIERLELR